MRNSNQLPTADPRNTSFTCSLQVQLFSQVEMSSGVFADSAITDAVIPQHSGCSRSPSPYSARPASSNSAPPLSPAHTVSLQIHASISPKFLTRQRLHCYSPEPDNVHVPCMAHFMPHMSTWRSSRDVICSRVAVGMHSCITPMRTMSNLACTCQAHQDVQQQPPQPDSEEQRVVYKSSPTQRAPSEPPEAAPSLSGRQLSADEDTLRQRLISAVQRPSGSGKAGQLADTLSLRCVQRMQHLWRAGSPDLEVHPL